MSFGAFRGFAGRPPPAFTSPNASMGGDDIDEQKRRIAALAAIEEGGGDISGLNLDSPEVITPKRQVIIPRAPVQVPSQPQTQEPAGIRDAELDDAKALDSDSRANRLFEAATRQLIAGITRTPVAPTLTQPTTKEADLKATRRTAQMDALKKLEVGMQGEKFKAEQDRSAAQLAVNQRKSEEDKARDLRDFEYRQKHDAEMLGASRDNSAATRELAGAQMGIAQKNRAGSDLSDLRKEYNQLPDVKTFGEVDAAYQKVKGAASDPSAAGDLSAIFAYMKMLDPGSSVREGEFANAQNAGGIDEKIRAQFNNVRNGQRLTPEQRADFIKQAEGLYQVHKKRRDAQASRYSDLAKKQGAAPEDVVGATERAAGPMRMKFPDGSEHDVDPADLELAKRKGAVPLGGR